MDALIAQAKLQKPELVREWEKKFVIPLSADIGKIVRDAEALARKNGWELQPREESNRRMTYFDTPEYHVFLRNQTIRQVVRFDEDGTERVRVDYKTGKRRRFEASLPAPRRPRPGG